MLADGTFLGSIPTTPDPNTSATGEPGANPLVAERAFPRSDSWGRTGVARGAEEMGFRG